MEISLDNISLSYGSASSSTRVLENFFLDVHPGQFVALAGRSGSGKSSAIGIAFGYITPDSGRVLWGDEDISTLKEKDRQKIRRTSIGYANQDALVFEDQSVRANVLTGGGTLQAAEKYIELLGLNDLSSKKAGKLSGGERQRVTVARALAKEPDVVLMDEPTSSLDSEAAQRVTQALRQAAERGAAVLIATHDDIVRGAANSVVWL